MSIEKSRIHLKLALDQLERAQVDSWEPSDPASCIVNAFYAYENLIVAAAEAKDSAWTKNHFQKADLAKRLAEEKTLSKDLSEELLRLNDLRKDVSYGEPGDDMENENLEVLVSNLEEVLEEVDSLLRSLEGSEEGE